MSEGHQFKEKLDVISLALRAAIKTMDRNNRVADFISKREKIFLVVHSFLALEQLMTLLHHVNRIKSKFFYSS